MSVKKQRMLFVILGTLMLLVSAPLAGACLILVLDGIWSRYFILPLGIYVAGLGLTLYGCYLWAKLKGRHWAWMFLGLLTPVGLLFLWKLKQK